MTMLIVMKRRAEDAGLAITGVKWSCGGTFEIPMAGDLAVVIYIQIVLAFSCRTTLSCIKFS